MSVITWGSPASPLWSGDMLAVFLLIALSRQSRCSDSSLFNCFVDDMRVGELSEPSPKQPEKLGDVASETLNTFITRFQSSNGNTTCRTWNNVHRSASPLRTPWLFSGLADSHESSKLNASEFCCSVYQFSLFLRLRLSLIPITMSQAEEMHTNIKRW